MLKREEWLPGIPCWIDAEYPDPPAAKRFYGELFGWDFDDRHMEGAPAPYSIALLHGLEVGGIGPQMSEQPGPPMWNTYVCVDSADDAAAKVKDAGGSVLAGPFDAGEAGRMAVFADPTGGVFCVWQPGTTRGAQLVNDAGTWNFSGLMTGDVETAKRFYGEVFGWQAHPFDADAGSFFWARPGYVDYLEKINPGTREQFASVGAPEGFEDAVAWVMPAEDGAPPHWSVVFSVDDADATAARAEELGGKVVVPPTDAPWVRTTTIEDPQGAVFTANKFVPPER